MRGETEKNGMNSSGCSSIQTLFLDFSGIFLRDSKKRREKREGEIMMS
jgi:hypothetical protein